MLKAAVLILALALQASLSLAMSSGPPNSACGTRVPSHGSPAQESESPYEMDVHYHDGHFDVLIIADSTPFMGFMLQAIDENNEIVGYFEAKDGDSKTMNCENAADSIAHSNPSAKTRVLAAYYQPEGSDGTGITIRATVLENYSVFWTNMVSMDLGDIEHHHHHHH